MSLALALKNRDSVVVAGDLADRPTGTLTFSEIMNVPGRAILMIAGNLSAVRQPIVSKVLPMLKATTSAAELAQYVNAALILDLVPHLDLVTGRIEIIVAGIDPVRHTEAPSIYYMDSAQHFKLEPVTHPYAAAGSTASVAEILEGRSLEGCSTDELIEIAKECLTSTKLRWPTAVGPYLEFGIVTPKQVRIINF